MRIPNMLWAVVMRNDAAHPVFSICGRVASRLAPQLRHCPGCHYVAAHPHVHFCCAQPADEKLGMVNIRSDDDATPEDVLAGMSAEDEAFVLGMKQAGTLVVSGSLNPEIP